MKFKDLKFSRQNRFSIGIEEETGKYYLSFPVTSTGFADYEEYYKISDEEFNSFSSDLDNAIELLERCKKRKEDDRLLIAPNKNRGTTC